MNYSRLFEPDFMKNQNALSIENLADRCVQCGLCLPSCPTYVLYQNENESPRGRIALAKALAQHQLPATKPLTDYLDHCLMCLACEKICPAEVAYGELLIKTRALIQTKNPTKKLPFWLHYLTVSARLRRIFSFLILMYQYTGLPILCKKITLFALLPQKSDRPTINLSTPAYAKITTKNTGKKVLLLTDCMTETLEPWVNQSTKRLLSLLGFTVETLPEQSCCGALHYHQGDMQQAQCYEKNNAKHWHEKTQHYDAIVSLATGCQQRFQHVFPGLQDILAFLATLNKCFINTRAQTVLWQNPCTAKGDLSAMLRSMSNLTCILLPQQCCGAAGLHLLQMPEQATAIADPLVEFVLQHTTAHALLSANIGCRLHLRRALRAKQCNIAVLHPSEWLLQILVAHKMSRN